MKSAKDPLWNIKQRLSAAEATHQSTFNLMGWEFIVNPGVFPPTHFLSTTIFSEALPYPVGGSLWEVGCGTGVTAVIAALKGCKKVLASDISSDAVENARQNIDKHSLGAVVDARCGDLFDVLHPGEKFDVIYWNSNFVYVPEDYVFDKDIHYAFADAGYKAHDRFFKEAPQYLERNGRILLGFSSQGDETALAKLLSAYRYSPYTVASRAAPGQASHRFDILELNPF